MRLIQPKDEFKSIQDFQTFLTGIIVHTASTDATTKTLFAAWIDTQLGPMLAMADEEKLYLLEFIRRRGLEQEIKRLQKKLPCVILFGATAILKQIETELMQYFSGELKQFKTPIQVLGTAFQQTVWNALTKIPYGQTRSYAEVAQNINKPSAYRAVANANGTNQLAIIIPCHRVINSDNRLGGYGGGIEHKKWLLEHEEKMKLL